MSIIAEERNGRTVCVLLENVGKAGIKALRFLLKHGETNAYRMTIEGSMGTGNTRSVLLQLHKMELVVQKEGKGNEILYALTEKGKKVAGHIEAAEQLLSEGT
jgi:predicted transcriptional regulator